jgi:hypothetical protein
MNVSPELQAFIDRQLTLDSNLRITASEATPFMLAQVQVLRLSTPPVLLTLSLPDSTGVVRDIPMLTPEEYWLNTEFIKINDVRRLVERLLQINEKTLPGGVVLYVRPSTGSTIMLVGDSVAPIPATGNIRTLVDALSAISGVKSVTTHRTVLPNSDVLTDDPLTFAIDHPVLRKNDDEGGVYTIQLAKSVYENPDNNASIVETVSKTIKTQAYE